MREFIRYTYKELPKPLFSGRPDREKIIQTDDIVDLKICLETSSDVLDIINDKYLFSN